MDDSDTADEKMTVCDIIYEWVMYNVCTENTINTGQ